MKIISVDNFDRELPGQSDDELIAENVTAFYAETIVNALNEKFCEASNSDRFFKAVPDDYKLRSYEP
jgi:hypothetical protein